MFACMCVKFFRNTKIINKSIYLKMLKFPTLQFNSIRCVRLTFFCFFIIKLYSRKILTVPGNTGIHFVK